MRQMIGSTSGQRKRQQVLYGSLVAGVALLMAAGGPAMAKAQRHGTTEPGATLSQPAGYELGPADTIAVTVYGQNEFNIVTRIKSDGSIVMPLIGRVEAQGRTVLTLADEIGKRLESGGYLRSPIVNVEVKEYGSRYVRVAGNVGNPGLFPLDKPYTLLDVLLRSGWVRGSDTVILRTADGKERKIDADRLARGDAGATIMMQPGDTVYVPEGELVYVTGQVARPGPYRLKAGMTVSELLAQAGGVSATGSTSKFDLTQNGEKQSKVEAQYKLHAGDIINVRERLF